MTKQASKMVRWGRLTMAMVLLAAISVHLTGCGSDAEKTAPATENPAAGAEQATLDFMKSQGKPKRK